MTTSYTMTITKTLATKTLNSYLKKGEIRKKLKNISNIPIPTFHIKTNFRIVNFLYKKVGVKSNG